jgi:hypothetical protein
MPKVCFVDCRALIVRPVEDWTALRNQFMQNGEMVFQPEQAAQLDQLEREGYTLALVADAPARLQGWFLISLADGAMRYSVPPENVNPTRYEPMHYERPLVLVEPKDAGVPGPIWTAQKVAEGSRGDGITETAYIGPAAVASQLARLAPAVKCYSDLKTALSAIIAPVWQ